MISRDSTILMFALVTLVLCCGKTPLEKEKQSENFYTSVTDLNVPYPVPQSIDSTALDVASTLGCDEFRILLTVRKQKLPEIYYVTFYLPDDSRKDHFLYSDGSTEALSNAEVLYFEKLLGNNSLQKPSVLVTWDLGTYWKDENYSGSSLHLDQLCNCNGKGFFHKVINNLGDYGFNNSISSHQFHDQTISGYYLSGDIVKAFDGTNRSGFSYSFRGTSTHADTDWGNNYNCWWVPWFPFQDCNPPIEDRASSLDITYWVWPN